MLISIDQAREYPLPDLCRYTSLTTLKLVLHAVQRYHLNLETVVFNICCQKSFLLSLMIFLFLVSFLLCVSFFLSSLFVSLSSSSYSPSSSFSSA
jgi:hypothetical protein